MASGMIGAAEIGNSWDDFRMALFVMLGDREVFFVASYTGRTIGCSIRFLNLAQVQT